MNLKKLSEEIKKLDNSNALVEFLCDEAANGPTKVFSTRTQGFNLLVEDEPSSKEGYVTRTYSLDRKHVATQEVSTGNRLHDHGDFNIIDSKGFATFLLLMISDLDDYVERYENLRKNSFRHSF